MLENSIRHETRDFANAQNPAAPGKRFTDGKSTAYSCAETNISIGKLAGEGVG
jgi:hypothetical protein